MLSPLRLSLPLVPTSFVRISATIILRRSSRGASVEGIMRPRALAAAKTAGEASAEASAAKSVARKAFGGEAVDKQVASVAPVAAAQRAAADAAAGKRCAGMASFKMKAVMRKIYWALFAALAVTLAIDHYVHEDDEYIKWRIARKLRACSLPCLPSESVLLPSASPPLTLGSRPTMVLGPTGCGKSTLLRKTALEMVKHRVPVVLVRMRAPCSSEGEGTAAAHALACVRMDNTAGQVFEQIDFPSRRSWTSQFLQAAFSATSPPRTGFHLMPPPSSDRLICALRLLFEVSETLYFERLDSGVVASDAPPVLLFDNVQDLIRDACLAVAGGRSVFDEIIALLFSYGADRHVVRAAVTGSSILLGEELADAAVAGKNEWSYYELQDPPERVVLAALRERGYLPEEARAILDFMRYTRLLWNAHAPPPCSALTGRRICINRRLSSISAGSCECQIRFCF